MRLQGEFINKRGERVGVTITAGDPTDKVITIGGEDSRVLFPLEDAATVECCSDSTLDRLMPRQARIRLLCRDFLGDLFQGSHHDTSVQISVDGATVFRGYLTPRTYQQGYAERHDELELTCIDLLTGLSHDSFGGIGKPGVDYDSKRRTAGIATFADLIGEMFPEDVTVWYDGSVRLSATTAVADSIRTLTELGANTVLFYGDDEDDVWTQAEVLTEILRYLNLHAEQRGDEVYLYNWSSAMGPTKQWFGLHGRSKTTVHPSASIDGTTAAWGEGAQITIGEVYNRIALPCSTEGDGTVVESPLDDNALTSPYANRQLYCTEISCDGEGATACSAFYAAVCDVRQPYDSGLMTDWYVQVRTHPSWTFPETPGGADLIDKYCATGKWQETVPNYLGAHRRAAILSMGKIDRNLDYADNSVTAKVDMTDTLVIAVNGDGRASADAWGQTVPSESDILGNIPVAVYTGPSGGSVYSPADTETTNYIVISGKITLNPVMEMTAPYGTIRSFLDRYGYNTQLAPSNFGGTTVPSRDNDDGRWYTRKYYKAETPGTAPAADTSNSSGLVPYSGHGPELCEYTYSAMGDSTDRISKVCAVACMLVIGDKCLVETAFSGSPSDFEWRTFKERAECASDDEYYSQCFTIGFDPKIGDKLIGTEFDIQNNVSHTMGIDAEGTAIPIKASDRLSGEVRFLILGPVNLVWSETTRRHGTWFRSVSWATDRVPVLPQLSNIQLGGLEIRLYSDNGRLGDGEGGDLIYMSDTDETYLNRHELDEMRLVSALTAEEANALGVSAVPGTNTVVNVSDSTGVSTVLRASDSHTAKPEQLLVDEAWTEYHLPRVQMTQTVWGTAETGWRRWTHPALPGKTFIETGKSLDLDNGITTLNLKETWQ